jgi:hypothetical protein
MWLRSFAISWSNGGKLPLKAASRVALIKAHRLADTIAFLRLQIWDCSTSHLRDVSQEIASLEGQKIAFTTDLRDAFPRLHLRMIKGCS